MTCRRLWLTLVVLVGSFFLAPDADAACPQCSCTVTATSVSFGTYDPLSSADDDSTGSVRVRCTLLLAIAGSFRVSLSTGSSGDYTGRTLRNGSNELLYNLYTSTARNQVWGNGTGGSAQVTQSFSGLLVIDRTLTVYGRIEGGQNVPSGAYSDTILVTVTY